MAGLVARERAKRKPAVARRLTVGENAPSPTDLGGYWVFSATIVTPPRASEKVSVVPASR
ncbi:MAG: hypothetical protein HZY79_12930 [Rhodoblastus sp.]|nr:MAG: hypothetical protein HZY79_12930 [Rhodoblastus sp.]